MRYWISFKQDCSLVRSAARAAGRRWSRHCTAWRRPEAKYGPMPRQLEAPNSRQPRSGSSNEWGASRSERRQVWWRRNRAYLPAKQCRGWRGQCPPRAAWRRQRPSQPDGTNVHAIADIGDAAPFVFERRYEGRLVFSKTICRRASRARSAASAIAIRVNATRSIVSSSFIGRFPSRLTRAVDQCAAFMRRICGKALLTGDAGVEPG